MLHKISEFCKKIDAVQAQSNRLYDLKYNQPKTVERDAEILLDLENLDLLRYRGQVSPYLEYRYLIAKFDKLLTATSTRDLSKEITDLI